jgi:tRNA threonylcarbamoyladenosine biosynthesis protein TsaE
MTFEVQQLSDLKPVCREIIRLSEKMPVVALYGNLGAGKTTLVQTLCGMLGITDTVSSPTYAIINEYALGNSPVYHIDLYRLNDEAEARQAGVEECLFSGERCFVEWPDRFENLLPEHHIKVNLRKLENDSRLIELNTV